jgi:DNA-binding MarR family transcriptional regulator
MELKQLQLLRKAFLLELYKITKGDRWFSPIMFDVGKSLGIENSLTESIVDYLVQKGYVNYETKERDISITIEGVDEAEKYLNQDVNSTNISMNIKEIQSLRNVYLIKLYELTGGNRWQFPNMFEIGESLGLDKSLTSNITDYLSQKGLIKIETLAGDISITSFGIDEVESFLAKENKTISHDEIVSQLDEINHKLDLLSVGQEIIYEDITEQLDKNGSIQKKDLRLLLISTIISKGLDSIKLAKIFEILK